MPAASLSWAIVDDTAASLGASAVARQKWRQRGVPAAWRIKIVERLIADGVPVALSEFDQLELAPRRMAA